jgi:hypothetical protein
LRGAPTAQAPAAPPVIVATPATAEVAQAAEALPALATRTTGAPADDIVYTPFALSIGDGFRLGCGIVLAVFVTIMGIALLVAIGFLIATVAGVSLPFGF